jgi:patatin-related protein
LREKELRIALICFGGVSLAVYIHGIGKEVLKLVRASSALHAIDRAARPLARFADKFDLGDPEYDTESIYFELLREIGRTIDLRVIVDIVAGASAGGINGTMLARALTHDLRTDKLRDLWLDGADVTQILAPEARARARSKWYLRPFIWGYAALRHLDEFRDSEMRRKLSLFVRSRWFKPPFDGMRMTELMYDAAISLGEPQRATASLLPAGHRLDLFVTLTDHHGYERHIEIHDPPAIEEREHRHILHFSYRRWPNGEIESDFNLPDAPALAFAARATSSFPGAFPPAQIAEIDRMCAARGIAWPGRDRFIAANFEPYRRAGLDPVTASFLDGSVLNNKPFREAIQAIAGRPAYRQVDRRLVYVDPDPDHPRTHRNERPPGFFATLKSALSDIPRNEPIADELEWISGFNRRVRRTKGIVDAARPHISELVSDIVALEPAQTATVDQIRKWREAINDAAMRGAGFAYEGYVRLKLAAVRALVGRLIAETLRLPASSPKARAITDIVDLWARRAGIVYQPAGSHLLTRETVPTDAALPPWVAFLLAFDLDYRKRRLYFLIQGQNRLYGVLDEQAPGNAAATTAVDRLKREFYRCVDGLRRRESVGFFSAAVRERANAIVNGLDLTEAGSREDRIGQFVDGNTAAIGALIELMAREIALDNTTRDLDVLLAGLDPSVWPAEARHEVLVNYLGFPFWDVQTLAMTNWQDMVEFDEILVDRISPNDAKSFARLHAATTLKCTGLAHFAGFFSRAYRENDYLLGRLHGVDRMIDIVCDAAAVNAADKTIDVVELKRRAFRLVLDAEEKHLPQCADLIRALRHEIVTAAPAQRLDSAAE